MYVANKNITPLSELPPSLQANEELMFRAAEEEPVHPYVDA